MATATITGQLTDSDGTPWINALWSAVAVSPSSQPVFGPNLPVEPVFGQLDASADFSGTLPRTDSILPPGTTLTITIYSVTSAPPSVIQNVIIDTPAVNLGALLSPLVSAPRIQSAALVYAYTTGEILNATHGDGYINTSENLSFLFVGNTWEPLNAGPSGQIYPPAGVAVSTGSAWAASLLQSSIATWPPAGVPVSTGTAWAASLPQASLATYPPAGMPVSSGSAWSASITNGTFPTVYEDNSATRSLNSKILTGFATLVAGTIQVFFANPFSNTPRMVITTIDASPAGTTTVAHLWLLSVDGVQFTVNASSATATNTFLWYAIGNGP